MAHCPINLKPASAITFVNYLHFSSRAPTAAEITYCRDFIGHVLIPKSV